MRTTNLARYEVSQGTNNMISVLVTSNIEYGIESRTNRV